MMKYTSTLRSLKFLLTGFLLLSVYSEIQAETVRNIFDARVPMRDGVELSADSWLPTAEKNSPAILIRTPYVKARGAPGPVCAAIVRAGLCSHIVGRSRPRGFGWNLGRNGAYIPSRSPVPVGNLQQCLPRGESQPEHRQPY